MKKPKTICSSCRKVKGVSCKCPPPTPFEGINKDNYPFYNSTQWRKLSKSHKKSNPLCVVCLQKGVATPVAITDHIVPIDKGGSKLDPNNLQSLCASHHNSKTGRGK